MSFMKLNDWGMRGGLLIATTLMLQSCGNQAQREARDGSKVASSTDASAEKY